MDLNKRLKGKIITEFGTQADFAQKISVDETYVSKIIRGRRELSDVEKRDWAATLCCDVKDIFEVANAK